MKQILKIVTICVICTATLMSGCLETTTTDECGTATLMSGCLETTTTDECGTATYNIVTEQAVIDIDIYTNGLHITGKIVHDGDRYIPTTVNIDGYVEGLRCIGTADFDGETYSDARLTIDGYIEGNHVTGTTKAHTLDSDWCSDWYTKVDMYKDGAHITGYMTHIGCGDDVEWYRCLVATKEGYKTQYVTGHDDAEWRT